MEIGDYLHNRLTPDEWERVYCLVNRGAEQTTPAECIVALDMCMAGTTYEGYWFPGDSFSCSRARDNTACAVPLDMFEGCVDEVAADSVQRSVTTCEEAVTTGFPSIRDRVGAACHAWLTDCSNFVGTLL
jgi:hypothetical protein